MVEQLCSGPVLTTFKDYLLHKQKETRIARARAAASALGNHDPMVETYPAYEARINTALNTDMAAPLDNPTVVMVQDSILHSAGRVIPTKALEMQKCYMQRCMRKPADIKIQQYVNHLTWINSQELPQLPPFSPTQALSNNKLMDVVVYGIPRS